MWKTFDLDLNEYEMLIQLTLTLRVALSESSHIENTVSILKTKAVSHQTGGLRLSRFLLLLRPGRSGRH